MNSFNYYKWSIWILMAMAFMISLFHRGAFAAISTQIVQELHLNATQLSEVVSITYYTYALMQIPAGILLDKWGFKRVSVVGIFIASFGSILLGCSSSLTLLLLSRFLIGFGTSAAFISILKAQRIWFNPKEFIKLSGLLSFLGCLGAILSTFPLALLSALIGWRITMILIGVMGFLLCGTMALHLHDSPSALGFSSIESTKPNVSINFLVSLKQCIFDPSTIRNFLILFTTVGSTTAITGLWGVTYITNVYHISAASASFYIAFILYGLLVGSLAINRIAGYFEHQLYLIPRYSLLGSFFLWFIFLSIFQGQPPLPVLAILFFLLGFCATSHLIAFVDINNKLKNESNGLANSIINSGEFLGSTMVSFSIGWLLDSTYVGTTINGFRIYDTQQYILSFSLFSILALLGLAATYIHAKKAHHEVNA